MPAKTSKHSPLLWEVVDNDTTQCGLLIVDSHNVYVARMEGDHGISVRDSLARAEDNAALIVRAVNSLDAMVKALKDAEEVLMLFAAGAGTSQEAALTAEAARAALKLAVGE